MTPTASLPATPSETLSERTPVPPPSAPREPAAPGDPPSFFAAAAALDAINEAVRTAQRDTPADGGTAPEHSQASADQALAALLLLRELREQLAGWESGLIETARAAGSSWADLAHPLGVASRQAAERRYLRVRPGPPGTTGEQRVRATREGRATDRSVTAWARTNAAELRQLAGQITALTDLPTPVRAPVPDRRRTRRQRRRHSDHAAHQGPPAPRGRPPRPRGTHRRHHPPHRPTARRGRGRRTG